MGARREAAAGKLAGLKLAQYARNRSPTRYPVVWLAGRLSARAGVPFPSGGCLLCCVYFR